MTLLILAAGLGSRYGGLKQLDGVGPNGELLIEYAIYDAIQVGFTKVVCVIKKENEEDFEEKISKKIRKYVEIEYAYQDISNVPGEYKEIIASRTKPLGTGHAILCAKEQIGNSSFAVINADDFYSRDAFQKLYTYMEGHDDYCLSAFEVQNTVSDNGTVSRGVCEPDAKGYLVSILEHEKIDSNYYNHSEPMRQLTAETLVSMNCWGFTSDVFEVFEQSFVKFLEKNKDDLSKCEFFLTYPISEVIEQKTKQIKVLRTNAIWYGVTYQEDKAAVMEALAKMTRDGIYPERLWEK